MSRFWRGLIPLLLLALVAGCSNKPDEMTIRQQVTEQLMQRHGTAIFDVLNFRKTNGIPRDENTYIAEVEYDLRFKVSLEEAANALQAQSGSIFSAGVGAATLGMRYGDFNAGDIVHRTERVRFIRSEKGWLIDEQPAAN